MKPIVGNVHTELRLLYQRLRLLHQRLRLLHRLLVNRKEKGRKRAKKATKLLETEMFGVCQSIASGSNSSDHGKKIGFLREITNL